MLLEGKKGLVLNVTNQNSLGWAIAQQAAAHGATVGVGALNERFQAGVDKLIGDNPAYVPLQVDFSSDESIEQMVRDAAERIGRIDFVVHAAATAKPEDLKGRFIETSRDGFALALDVSAYSFIAMCRALEPILNDDASVVTLSYLGSQRAIPGYNVMGVAKAALEASVRYLSVDLGERGIRVNALSPGPAQTISARGISNLREKMERAAEISPLKRPAQQDEVGLNGLWLISDLSRGVSGQVVYIDAGYNIAGL